jgi:transposase
LPQTVDRIKKRYPKASVELWGEDEHRIGLLPIIRRVWAPKGLRPVVNVQHRYQWMYLVGFVCPQKGESFWLIVPTVTLEAFEKCLKEFAQFYNLGKGKKVILVIDRAGYHQEKNLKVPIGIILEWLPAYSPQLQPAERLWVLSNEGVANKHFASLDILEEQQIKRCQMLRTMKKEIQKRCLFN